MDPKIVLIIEDNASHAELITEIFDRHFSPIVIHTVDDFNRAISLLNDNDYDLIISDCLLGESAILTHFAHLKNTAKNIPIIVISGVDDAQMAASLTKLGASDYISKTSESLDQLPSIIAKYFNAKKTTKHKHKRESKRCLILPEQILKKTDEISSRLNDLIKKNQKNPTLKSSLKTISSELMTLKKMMIS